MLPLKYLFVCCVLIGFLFPSALAASKKPKQDYYQILEVEKDATPKEIKKSYFKLAMKYHPDKNPDAKDRIKLEQKFSLLSHAYEVISNPKTREKYDELLKKGQLEYTTEEIKRQEEREAMEEDEHRGLHARHVFDEFERESDLEYRQKLIDYTIIATVTICALLGGLYYLSRSKKLKAAVGLQQSNPSNVNNSKNIPNVILQDRERVERELEKQRIKEERERATAEKIKLEVEKRRAAFLEEEEARQALIDEERAAQKALKEERRRLQQEKEKMKEAGYQEGTESAQNDDENVNEDGYGDDINDILTRAIAEATKEEKQKLSKDSKFSCPPCKKSFKSEEQLENHLVSKKHKSTVKELEESEKKSKQASKQSK